jgi:glutamate N-acetyltransferase/amino-acid N-acetyltransferase
VRWNERICAQGSAQAVFINSGNANTATGAQGRRDVEQTAGALAQRLKLTADDVCVCSTGVIGAPLPMDRILEGVTKCADALSQQGHAAAAEAILTTDTVAKEYASEVTLPGGTITLGAMAKGSGMIMPNMATMIAVITTDAALRPGVAAELLRRAVNASFNRIAIDNDMSTSDTVLLLANGAASHPEVQPDGDEFDALDAALTACCQNLAKQLVRDGEGATKFVEIIVEGARSERDAHTIAKTIATSQLCKTAWYGEDPNWGRIVCAAGYAGPPIEPEALAIWIGGVQVAAEGRSTDYREEDAQAAMKARDITIRVSVGGGPGSAVFWTSDLTHDYVNINAAYRT